MCNLPAFTPITARDIEKGVVVTWRVVVEQTPPVKQKKQKKKKASTTCLIEKSVERHCVL